MRRLLLPAVLVIALFSSCKHTWPQEDVDSLRNACLEDAKSWASGPDQAKTYCDCVVEKVMKKYPQVTDALENMDKIAQDPEVRACRDAAKK